MKFGLIVAIGLSVTIAGVSPSWAGGFLADTFVRPFSPSSARKLDQVHKDLGNLLDHAANGTAGVAAGVVTANPAAGTAVTTALEARDAVRRQN